MKALRVLALVVLGFVLTTLRVVGSSMGGRVTTPPAFPFPAGTTWTYRSAQTFRGGPSSVGTATWTYGGTTSYRGITYHFADVKDTLTQGATERTYFTWNPVATARATVLTGTNQNLGTYEIIYGGAGIAVAGAAQATSGMAQCFLNGEPWGTVSWSASSTYAGTVIVTVPAGTFTTTRWNWLLTFSGSCWTWSQTASSYMVGATEIRRDGAFSGLSTYSLELQSGPVSRTEVRPQRAEWPVRVLIPGVRALRSGIPR